MTEIARRLRVEDSGEESYLCTTSPCGRSVRLVALISAISPEQLARFTDEPQEHVVEVFIGDVPPYAHWTNDFVQDGVVGWIMANTGGQWHVDTLFGEDESSGATTMTAIYSFDSSAAAVAFKLRWN
jgi:hypothetical protein